MELKNEEEAMKLVKGFIEEYLHGNIDELKNFSFWDIEGTKYDGNPKEKFDGDRTEIVYALDYLLYKDRNIPNFSINALGNIYTGDTINTFRTLFGSPLCREYVANQFNFSHSERQRIDSFYWTYQQLGNFYILPCKTLPNTKTSINSYRGKTWKDYFDIFLSELKKCLNNENGRDEKLYQLKEENDFFFSKINNIYDFLDKFYLEDYLTVEYNHPSDYVCGRHRFSEKIISKEQYKQFAFSYIQKATDLINKRSAKLVDVLKEKLKLKVEN